MTVSRLNQRIAAFLRDPSGTFGMMLAVVSVPIMVCVGCGVDYGIAARVKGTMQNATDAASLALASTRSKDQKEMQTLAESIISANMKKGSVNHYVVKVTLSDNDTVTIDLDAAVDTTFMRLANINETPLHTRAVAARAVTGRVEVSLVLDNTWSMSETDSRGIQKIVALRSSATSLVTQLFSNVGADVRVAVVPYADYVNVGVANRYASWLTVPADSTTTSARTCKTITSEDVCTKRAPSYSCTSTTDGVTTTGTCTGACTETTTKTYDPPKESCSGGTTSTSSFYGCIGSRKVNSVRLADGSPTVTYPGFIATSRQCPTEILPLTNDKVAVMASIAKMAPNSGTYKPSTYIPAGLIWGLNSLSSTAPFTEGAAYDTSNLNPRKALVLMTDGDNTLRYDATAPKDSTTGKHIAIGTNSDGSLTSAGVTQLAATNADTRTLCANIKSADRRIEIFTVALAVDNDEARSILQSCASNSPGTMDHYYDASDALALAAAFSGIAQKLSTVRIQE